MKTITLNFTESAWAAVQVATSQSAYADAREFCFETVREGVASFLEDLKREDVEALLDDDPGEDADPLPTRTVAVELSPLGAGLLAMITEHDGHRTEADAFRAMLADAGGSLCRAMGREAKHGGKLEQRLRPWVEIEHGADEPAAPAGVIVGTVTGAVNGALNRPDLVPVAAAKPPKP